MATVAHVVAVAAGLTILAAIHADLTMIWNRGLLKSVALATGLAVVGAVLIAAARTIS